MSKHYFIMMSINNLQILLNTFQLGFLYNALARRLSVFPYPSDTIYPVILACLGVFLYIPLFIVRQQLLCRKTDVTQ